MPTMAFTGCGTQLFVDGARIPQVQTLLWDHSFSRLRATIIYWGENGQEVLHSFRAGQWVLLRLELPDKTVRTCQAVVRFCRTRFRSDHAVRTVVEFDLDREGFSQVTLKEEQ